MYVCMYVEAAQIVKQMYPCIRQRTLFFVTLRREKPVQWALACVQPPLPSKKKNLSPQYFLGEEATVHRLVGVKREEGGCIK